MSTNDKTPGRFVWRELMTSDVEAAKGFYGELLGWSFQSMDMGPGGTYWLISVGGAQRGGLMKLPANVPAPPHWMSYVSVEDVDATIAKAKAAGGQAPMGSMTMDGVGTMAVIMDPQGAATMAYCGVDADPTPERPKPGEFCWESLSTTDLEAAKRFYTEVYGWKASSFAGMTTFGVADGMEGQIADAQSPPPGAPSFWNTHVVVENLASSVARVDKLGGKVLMADIDVPGIGHIGMVQDPQGAVIALFQPNPDMGA